MLILGYVRNQKGQTVTLAEIGTIIACVAWEQAEGRNPQNLRLSKTGAKISYAGNIDGYTSCVPTQIHFFDSAKSDEEVYDAAYRICRELSIPNWLKYKHAGICDINLD